MINHVQAIRETSVGSSGSVADAGKSILEIFEVKFCNHFPVRHACRSEGPIREAHNRS